MLLCIIFLIGKKLHQHLKGAKIISKYKFQYFTSVPILETNEKAKELFLNIYEKTRPFYRCLPTNKSPSFIVTHAPCLNKYLFLKNIIIYN